MSRSETFFYAGYVFDAERAKYLARNYKVYWIKSHRAVGGGRVFLERSYDLTHPVIFLTFIHRETGEVGALLIDGCHRMQWAAKHKKELTAIFLNPTDSWGCSGYHNPAWTNRWVWRKLAATARLYGLEFTPWGKT